MSTIDLQEVKRSIQLIDGMRVRSYTHTSKILFEKNKNSVEKLEELGALGQTSVNKVLWVIAGPNGSGKSSLVAKLCEQPDFPEYFFSVDEMAKMDRLSYIEDERERYIMALTQCEWYRDLVLRLGGSLAMETPFSTVSKINFIEKAKELGYLVRVIFVGTENVELNVDRIDRRLELGGSDVPRNKVMSRYKRSLILLSGIWKKADVVEVYDNSRRCPKICALKYLDKMYLFNKEVRPAWIYGHLVTASLLMNQELDKVTDMGVIRTQEFVYDESTVEESGKEFMGMMSSF